MGLFSGRRPKNLGVDKGRFTAPPTWKPNWVSSQISTTDKHYVPALEVSGSADAAMKKLLGVIQGMEGATVVTQRANYCHVEFSTKSMGFVDDAEFYFDGKQIQLRSSARLGIRDFDVNRKRVKAIRAALGR